VGGSTVPPTVGTKSASSGCGGINSCRSDGEFNSGRSGFLIG